MKPEIVGQLRAYREKDKFAAEAWEARGLHPSAAETCTAMNALLNDCLDELLTRASKRMGKTAARDILSRGLDKATRTYYDSEEREFICDGFHHIAQLLGINFGTELREFLYGPELALSLALTKMQPKVYKVRTQPCANCGTNLETLVIEQEDVPEYSWFVVQCNACDGYDLLAPGGNAKEFKFGNYRYVEQINKDRCTWEEAQAKVTRLKNQ